MAKKKDVLLACIFLKGATDFRKGVFKVNSDIFFPKGFSVIVGDQGSGKSSLLMLMNEADKRKDVMDCYLVDTKESIKTAFFDTEKSNPRTKSWIESGKEGIFQISALFSSHGETLRAIMNALSAGENTLFMIDEPEAGLHIKSIVQLIENIKKAVKNGCHFILATHHPMLIEAAGKQVFDMEKWKWTNGKEYVNEYRS